MFMLEWNNAGYIQDETQNRGYSMFQVHWIRTLSSAVLSLEEHNTNGVGVNEKHLILAIRCACLSGMQGTGCS